MNNLVIVESNAKASKIKGYLDSKFPEDNWQVNACLGHICDLPNDCLLYTSPSPRDPT